MEQLKKVPVHVHSIANYRVSAFFYRYRRDVLGMNDAEARAEMEQVWHPEGVWAARSGRPAAARAPAGVDASIDKFSCAVMQERLVVEQPT
jgi:hypothetical protein